MYDFRIDAADKPSLYRELAQAADALTAGEPDAIANMANVAALLWEALPDLNWAGFYRNVGGELVLGPFQGRPACIRIPFGKGVCGTAAATGEVQRVDDVDAFPGHIACDSASHSELVVPILVAYDPMFQERIIGRAVAACASPERVLYRPDAILPEPAVGHWVIEITRRMVGGEAAGQG